MLGKDSDKWDKSANKFLGLKSLGINCQKCQYYVVPCNIRIRPHLFNIKEVFSVGGFDSFFVHNQPSCILPCELRHYGQL